MKMTLLLLTAILLSSNFKAIGEADLSLSRTTETLPASSIAISVQEKKPAIADGENPDEEIAATLSIIDQRNPRRWLSELVANRLEDDFTLEQLLEFRRNLPFEINRRIDERKSAEVNKAAQKVFAAMKAPRREAIVFTSKTPLVMTFKGHFVMVSTAAVEILSADELAAQIAHETAHLFWISPERRAALNEDYRAARIIELRCDAAAIIASDALGIDKSALQSGLEKMTRRLKKQNAVAAVPTHPVLETRKKLAAEIAKLLARERRHAASPSADEPCAYGSSAAKSSSALY